MLPDDVRFMVDNRGFYQVRRVQDQVHAKYLTESKRPWLMSDNGREIIGPSYMERSGETREQPNIWKQWIQKRSVDDTMGQHAAQQKP
jgi:hypothetical protein